MLNIKTALKNIFSQDLMRRVLDTKDIDEAFAYFFKFVTGLDINDNQKEWYKQFRSLSALEQSALYGDRQSGMTTFMAVLSLYLEYRYGFRVAFVFNQEHTVAFFKALHKRYMRKINANFKTLFVMKNIQDAFRGHRLSYVFINDDSKVLSQHKINKIQAYSCIAKIRIFGTNE